VASAFVFYTCYFPPTKEQTDIFTCLVCGIWLFTRISSPAAFALFASLRDIFLKPQFARLS
jgi:hypothetical protein